MPKKLERCVKKVKKTGKSKSSAFAICNASLKNEEEKEMTGLNIWVTEYGEVTIPDNILEGVRLTKGGYPDKRSPLSYCKFMNWVSEQENRLKEEFHE